MIYEMRVYRCLPGRLPALLKRFDTITLKLWEKHGIKQAGFFTTLVGESNQELTYFLAWDSLAEREKRPWPSSPRGRELPFDRVPPTGPTKRRRFR